MPNVYTTGLHPDQIDDLTNNTLHRFDRDQWTDISTSVREYFAYTNMLLRDKTGIEGGDLLQWQVKVRNAGSAKNTGMYAVDNVSVQDVSKNCQIGWTKQTCNMAYDIDEPAFQSGDMIRIVSLLKLRRHAALTDFADLMESNFWGLPADTTTDAEILKPYGVPYWIVRNASQGFNGTVPIGGGHTTVAGLSPTTYPNWANYTDQYAAMSLRDMVRRLRRAIVMTRFKPPVPYPSTTPQSPRYVIATVYDVESRMEEMLEGQNQNLGNDVASKDGQVLFRKIPINSVPYLEDNHDPTGAVSTNHYGKNPIYGIDKGSFRMIFKSGAFMRRTKPLIAPNQNTVRHIHWDSWTQFQCFNRRCNWVLTQSA